MIDCLLDTLNLITKMATGKGSFAQEKRPLKTRYTAIFIDSIHLKIRRTVVDTDEVYIAYGIDKEGYRGAWFTKKTDPSRAGQVGAGEFTYLPSQGAFLSTVKRSREAPVYYHSDQGSEYRSLKYVKEVEALGIYVFMGK